jgi:hypothetical protein
LKSREPCVTSLFERRTLARAARRACHRSRSGPRARPCFEAKPPHPARPAHLFKAPSRLTRSHLHEPRRAAMNAAWVSSCFCSTHRPLGLPNILPRPHKSSKHRALPRTSLRLTGVLAAADTAHRAPPCALTSVFSAQSPATNRVCASMWSSPTVSPAKSGGGLAGIRPPAPPACPWTTLQEKFPS